MFRTFSPVFQVVLAPTSALTAGGEGSAMHGGHATARGTHHAAEAPGEATAARHTPACQRHSAHSSVTASAGSLRAGRSYASSAGSRPEAGRSRRRSRRASPFASQNQRSDWKNSSLNSRSWDAHPARVSQSRRKRPRRRARQEDQACRRRGGAGAQ